MRDMEEDVRARKKLSELHQIYVGPIKLLLQQQAKIASPDMLYKLKQLLKFLTPGEKL
jgi:hypothetical protein